MKNLIDLYKEQRDEYSAKLLKNIEDFSMADTQEEMMIIAKKGAGFKLMLEHAENEIDKLEKANP